MMWPAAENATLTVFAGTLDLPVRPTKSEAVLTSLPRAETAPPEPTTTTESGVVRINRLGLELGGEREFRSGLANEDPISTFVEMNQTQTMARDDWRIRIQTFMRISCTTDAYMLQATLRAWEGDNEVC